MDGNLLRGRIGRNGGQRWIERLQRTEKSPELYPSSSNPDPRKITVVVSKISQLQRRNRSRNLNLHQSVFPLALINPLLAVQFMNLNSSPPYVGKFILSI